MKVYVRATARLHLGILDLGGDLGRLFGGIGVAIDHPSVVVEAENSDRLEIEGEESELVKTWVEVLLKKFSLKPKVTVRVRKIFPRHVGLGSGTQLALATAKALTNLFGLKTSIQELSQTLERGTVSGVGTALFERGGFVVETGVRSAKNKPILGWRGFPPVIFQEPFPRDWFFTVAIPQVKLGLSGKAEAHAFSELPPMSPEQSGKVSHIVLMSLVPALKERDIAVFGSALNQIQNIVGDCFASVQGGRFSSSISAECLDFMLEHGALGAGQSSWGPTVYGLVQGRPRAEKLKLQVNALLQETVGGQVFCVSPNNRGAYIKITK